MEATSPFITISDTEQQHQKSHGILESALRNFSINARNNIIFEYLTLTQAIWGLETICAFHNGSQDDPT